MDRDLQQRNSQNEPYDGHFVSDAPSVRQPGFPTGAYPVYRRFTESMERILYRIGARQIQHRRPDGRIVHAPGLYRNQLPVQIRRFTDMDRNRPGNTRLQYQRKETDLRSAIHTETPGAICRKNKQH